MPQNPPPIILDLIEHFERNIESYRSPAYNEAQVRQEFINPFFEALGWDVANKERHAEAYKDVIHEDAIKVGAPDYCFRIGGARKFFLEAKKPAVHIKEDPDPAYQLRRYAWSAKLPLSILTDFEEFAVYDCRARPSPSDKASAGRIHYLTYKEYATRWDEIASVFSKDAVLKGSFDKYAVSERKRGTTTVDAEFLAEIEKWREDLAKNLAVRNTALDVHELNFAVQRTIDRLIFLRICEDRGIEPYAQLQALLNGENIYCRLRHLYDQADDRYNSGLFHFRSEKERAETPDELTPRLKIDDKVLKDIIHGLYYPASPYEFSVMPAEILGQVYEQFLGKVIRLTSGHQAKVEEKPEVKKAGGVYYTPAYIVAYIVRNTVGKIVGAAPRGRPDEGTHRGVPLQDGLTPKQISKIRILDPACGSGSFLIGAYDYLVAYHRDWYLKDGAKKHTKELYQGAGGLWHLTTQEKKRILLNNIYGVDIDSQAVEVTKLSLLLKVLEGENQETLKKQLKMWHERALPDLGRNIKCGNSLIGPDYFTGQLLPDEDEMRRVNPFDWHAEFPHIFPSPLRGEGKGEGGPSAGSGQGFDAVIGNPPYGFHQIHNDQVKAYFKSHLVASQGSFEHYFLFYEASLKLLKSEGLHGFIVPVTWLTIPSAHSLRKFILEKFAIREIAWLPELVFSNAQVNTLVSTIARVPPNKVHVKIYDSLGFQNNPKEEFTTDQARFIKAGHVIGIFETESDAGLLDKIARGAISLDKLARPCSGYNPYEVGKGERPGGGPHDKQTIETKPYHSTRKEGKLWKPEIVGRDLGRYTVTISGNRWIKYGPWLAAPRDPENFTGKRILVQEITGGKAKRIIAGYYEGELYHSRDVIPVKCGGSAISPFCLLGIVNSRLITWYHHKRSPKSQKALFPKVLVSDIAKLPIRPINISDKSDKAKHDKMVALVERMLDLHTRLATAKAPDDKTRLQRQIDATDCEIDRLVYDLYGLTEEEIAIVEGKVVASGGTECENAPYEDAEPSSHRPRRGGRQTTPVAKASQHAGESGGGASQSAPGSSGPVHGVRERTGEYGPPEDPSERAEGEAERLGSTRYFETAEGTLSYTQVSERLVVSLAGILQEILQTAPEQITITPEWLCLRHQALAGHLFPEWAGRFRDVNVQVGSHTPPPFYEIPVLMRLFCDDLSERLRHIRPRESEVGVIVELLAWADGRFQGIHPFKDFNGRIGRVLLAAVLYKLALPHVETAPTAPGTRQEYLNALNAADAGNLGPLQDLWTRRILDDL